MPGITWNSCCSPCPHGASSHPPHVECLYLPWTSSIHRLSLWNYRKASIGTTPLQGFLLLLTWKIPPTGARPTPSKRGIFEALRAHPQDSKCFHAVLNLQENQRLVAHHRTQPFQHTFLNPYHRTQLLPYNLHHRTQPLKDNFLDRRQLYSYTSAQISSYLHPHDPDGTPASFEVFTLSKRCLPCFLSTRKASQKCRAHPLLCPKVTKATLLRVPHAFAQTAYPSQPTPLEHMVNMSHWGPLEDAPPQAILSSCFISAVQWASLTGGNPQSQHSSSLSLSTLRSEMLDSSGAWVSCSNANICCLSSSKHLCMLQLVWHHREYHP